MNCESSRHLLPLYFDGELDPAASRAFESHLDGCAACRQALHELETLRARLRDPAARFAAPAALRARLAATAPARPRMRNRPWLALAASWLAAAAVGAGSAGLWQDRQHAVQAQAQLTRDLFAGHWRALAAASPVDVVSTDRHTVKPWFAGKVAESPPVHDFAAQGFPLAGGRIDYAGSARVPVLVYRHGGHLIDVFVLASADPGLPRQAQMRGYGLRTLALGHATAAVVSDMDEAELDRFAQLLAQGETAAPAR
ncbi:hypothetical protein ASG87_08710 [Frateuria sp. Soil773]|uniref:anti-sigma factor family protein n=1 Tax=Frateuria sp. Soil773 TaxID=1736407 RepID=UPI0006F2EBA2|nr:zf-HC2 domain-containing protein [Frateuria sp. Soil773]KRE88651.1 hypothetical protein ASG87_08710 [Frateuria sp. Soil773]